MKGTMLIYRPGEEVAEIKPLDHTPDFIELHNMVGGEIEVVPLFGTIKYGDKIEDCVAFCAEFGKIESFPVNRMATMEWERALARRGDGHTLFHADGSMKDFLVGNIVVVFGDAEFMGNL